MASTARVVVQWNGGERGTQELAEGNGFDGAERGGKVLEKSQKQITNNVKIC